jgi:hypothetical protein
VYRIDEIDGTAGQAPAFVAGRFPNKNVVDFLRPNHVGRENARREGRLPRIRALRESHGRVVSAVL